MEDYLLYVCAYLWVTASFVITQLWHELHGLRNWEKILFFFLWPIVGPIGAFLCFLDWLKK